MVNSSLESLEKIENVPDCTSALGDSGGDVCVLLPEARSRDSTHVLPELSDDAQQRKALRRRRRKSECTAASASALVLLY